MSFLRHLVPPPGPIRILAASSLGRSVGHGMLLSVSVLFFTRSVGLPATQVGLGLTIAAVVGMLTSVPAGHAADVLGARTTATFFVVLQGVLICGYALVGGFVGFLIAASLVVMAEAGSDASRGALVAGVVPQGERVKARAFIRSVNNIGISLGAVSGGVALHFDTRSVYVGLLIACGVVYAAAGLVYLVLPKVEPAAKKRDEDGGPRWVVLRDRPFVVVALINAVLVMNGGILTVALPIWIAQRTTAPTWVYAAILVLNTVMVVLFQVRVSQGTDDAAGGAKALRRAGLALAACCGLFALAAGQPAWVAVARWRRVRWCTCSVSCWPPPVAGRWPTSWHRNTRSGSTRACSA
ncbi:MFS transporter [Lentzea sp. PSKA42]|uniref:MFS transporter n=1 Tax=Lentzea indica TaxID=2604800 RepID=A0ABX1FDR3_9PSEU|nr:MFS transporter [Lentzea indica]NKE57054.1 MFS transporter [Lentzea indica]